MNAAVMVRVPVSRLFRSITLLCLLVLAGLASPAAAGDVRLAWDPNVEADLAGYVVLIGTASRVYTQSLEVGPQAADAQVEGLSDGTTYYFAVRAVNTAGLQSGLSNEVSVVFPSIVPQPGQDGPTVQALSPGRGPTAGGTLVTLTGTHFETGAIVLLGDRAVVVINLTPTSLTFITPVGTAGLVNLVVRNPDGREAITSNAFAFEAAPGEPDVPDTAPPALPFLRYFAEGVQSDFFSTRFALANPHGHAVSVRARLTDTFGQETVVPVQVPAGARITLDRTNLPLLASDAFGSRFEASAPIAIDRTVEWDRMAVYGAHSETGIEAPGTSWYLAEGATHSGFNLFYLLQNSTDQTAEVRLRYFLSTGGIIENTHLVGPRARTNIWVNKDDPALASAEMSAQLVSVNDVPIVVERSMYLNTGNQLFTAGHNSAAVAAPALRWFLAEGATGDYFDTFVLVANPQDTEARLRVTYLLAGDVPVQRLHVVPAHSRYTIWVDQEGARLARADVSTLVEVTNDVPVIVERSVWWPATPGGSWVEAHNSAGATTTASRWVMADGQASGPSMSTYALVANTGEAATAVRFTLLPAEGAGRSIVERVEGRQRFSLDVAAAFPEVANATFGLLVESLDEAPLVVERSTYRDGLGIKWAAGTNSLATPLESTVRDDISTH